MSPQQPVMPPQQPTQPIEIPVEETKTQDTVTPETPKAEETTSNAQEPLYDSKEAANVPENVKEEPPVTENPPVEANTVPPIPPMPPMQAPPKKKKEPKPKKKGRKAKIIFISVLSGLLVIALTLTILFFTSPANSVNNKMKAGDFEGALAQYSTEVYGNGIQESILDMLLKDRTSELKAQYDNKEIDFESANAELIVLARMGFDGAQEAIEEITEENAIETALSDANEYLEKGDYVNAIMQYLKVPEVNEHYEEAQGKLDQAYAEYLDSTVKGAKDNNKAGDFKQAIRLINNAYDLLPDDIDTSKLDAVKAESLAAYQAEVTEEVDLLVGEERYTDALEVINAAAVFEDNEYFANLKTSTEEKYVKYVTEKVDDYLDEEDYISAQRVADNAVIVLPDNSDLKALQKRVKTTTPTYLMNAHQPYSTQYYEAYINGETFNMGGNLYTNGFVLYDEGSAVFNLAGNYTSMSLVMGHIDGSDKVDAVIKIYCDNILKKEIEIGAESLPKKITIDVTGVEQIKFDYPYVYLSPRCGFANITVK